MSLIVVVRQWVKMFQMISLEYFNEIYMLQVNIPDWSVIVKLQVIGVLNILYLMKQIYHSGAASKLLFMKIMK